jgi:hypothetical protein
VNNYTQGIIYSIVLPSQACTPWTRYHPGACWSAEFQDPPHTHGTRICILTNFQVTGMHIPIFFVKNCYRGCCFTLALFASFWSYELFLGVLILFGFLLVFLHSCKLNWTQQYSPSAFLKTDQAETWVAFLRMAMD